MSYREKLIDARNEAITRASQLQGQLETVTAECARLRKLAETYRLTMVRRHDEMEHQSTLRAEAQEQLAATQAELRGMHVICDGAAKALDASQAREARLTRAVDVLSQFYRDFVPIDNGRCTICAEYGRYWDDDDTAQTCPNPHCISHRIEKALAETWNELKALSGVCKNCHGEGIDGDPHDANGEGGGIWACTVCGGSGRVAEALAETGEEPIPPGGTFAEQLQAKSWYNHYQEMLRERIASCHNAQHGEELAERAINSLTPEQQHACQEAGRAAAANLRKHFSPPIDAADTSAKRADEEKPKWPQEYPASESEIFSTHAQPADEPKENRHET